MEENKFFKVIAPNGYEINKEKSTFENIVFKNTEQGVKTWEDLIGKQIPDGSKWIYDEGEIDDVYGKFDSFDKCVFIDERHAKSALAMAQISQLIPYYGGAITDEEWGNSSTIKHVIVRMEGKLDCAASFVEYIFLAFHTAEQRDKFLKYNKQLVNDYLMLG